MRADLRTKERMAADALFERDPRGSIWIKGRVCAALIYLGWTLIMFAVFTSENPKNFSATCATVGGWLCGIGFTSGLAWVVRKVD